MSPRTIPRIGQVLRPNASAQGTGASNVLLAPNPVREVPDTGLAWGAQQIAFVQQYQALRPQLLDVLARGAGPDGVLSDRGALLTTQARELANSLSQYRRPTEAQDLQRLAQRIETARYAQTTPSPGILSRPPAPVPASLPTFPNALASSKNPAVSLLTQGPWGYFSGPLDWFQNLMNGDTSGVKLVRVLQGTLVRIVDPTFPVGANHVPTRIPYRLGHLGMYYFIDAGAYGSGFTPANELSFQ